MANNKKLIASLLKLNRKRIYYQGKQELKDLAIKEQIEKLHLIHPSYGHKRVALALGIGHNSAKRVMAKFGLKPPRRVAKKLWLTKSTTNHHFTNLIRNIIPARPTQVFVSDLTYLKFQGKNIYLATVEDIFTREIIAAKLSDRHDSSLTLSTISEAIRSKETTPEFFHSDQGSEFMAEIVTKFLEKNMIKISVSDKASPWQNGYKESFFGRFKEENGDLNRFETLGELIEEIYCYVFYYNNLRIHTSLKMPPVLFKRKFLDADNVSRKSGT